MKLWSTHLKGKVKIPSSKSYCHRYIIAASFAKKESVLDNVSMSDDIKSTLEIVKKLGAKIEQKNQFMIKKNLCIFSAQNRLLLFDFLFQFQ